MGRISCENKQGKYEWLPWRSICVFWFQFAVNYVVCLGFDVGEFQGARMRSTHELLAKCLKKWGQKIKKKIPCSQCYQIWTLYFFIHFLRVSRLCSLYLKKGLSSLKSACMFLHILAILFISEHNFSLGNK